MEGVGCAVEGGSRAKDLAQVEPGYDVDTEGEGDILRVTRKPQSGHRTVTMDDDGKSVPIQYPLDRPMSRWTRTRSRTQWSSMATMPNRRWR